MFNRYYYGSKFDYKSSLITSENYDLHETDGGGIFFTNILSFINLISLLYSF